MYEPNVELMTTTIGHLLRAWGNTLADWSKEDNTQLSDDCPVRIATDSDGEPFAEYLHHELNGDGFVVVSEWVHLLWCCTGDVAALKNTNA